jgi:HEPN domain-containing protein
MIMTEYYIEERYPFTVPSPLTEDEIKESLEAAVKLIERIKEIG